MWTSGEDYLWNASAAYIIFVEGVGVRISLGRALRAKACGVWFGGARTSI
jgi:hypothetical protein